MRLSIIIPVYNRERFIEGCIRSLVAGGAPDIEILAVDDGSSDHSVSILETLCREFPCLRLIKQENKGPGGARNTGMRAAKGDWIWFIDSDDYVVPGAVSYVLETIPSYPDVDTFVISETWSFDDPSRNYPDIPLPPEKADLSGKEALREGTIPLWSSHRFIFRRTFMDSPWITFPEKVMHEDEYFGLVLLYTAKHLHILDKSIYHYIQHDVSVMSTRSIRNAGDVFKIYQAICAFIDSDAVAPEDKQWLNGHYALWIIYALRRYRKKEGYSDVIRPVLPALRREYNRRARSLPFHIRLRDNARMLRARFRG